ncbi:MAG: deoxyguanosinetriphosphate triphosphohydrolase, partial [Candidatus Omnitrophota bacterium]
VLEKRYPAFPGLNLTFEVREGIAKHSTLFDRPRLAVSEERGDEGPASLETQVVDVADEIAYDNHDLDDGLTSGLIEEKAPGEVPLWRDVESMVKKQYPDLSWELKKFQIVKTLINMQVTDVIENTEKRLKEFRIQKASDVKNMPEKIVMFSKKMHMKRQPLREFLSQRLYRHYRVVRMSDKAARFLKSLFDVYLRKPEQLPTQTAARLKKEDTFRVVCDYIAGMTDRYALDEYKKFFEPYERV